jgi:cytochrome c553
MIGVARSVLMGGLRVHCLIEGTSKIGSPTTPLVGHHRLMFLEHRLKTGSLGELAHMPFVDRELRYTQFGIILLSFFMALMGSLRADERLEFGAYLAQQCSTCHRMQAETGGIHRSAAFRGLFSDRHERISNLSATNITMVKYRLRTVGGRNSTHALSAYYASLPAPALPERSPADSTALRDYGEYLSSQCTSCHQLAARSGGIPPLGHLPRDYFITAMGEYQNGQRDNSTMVNVARSLNDDEILALAYYYTTSE